jgi:alpha,alpha-trehalase
MKTSSTWKLIYNHFEPKQEGLRETLCTLGNGYFATRGAFPEALASDIHYPGTYIAGVYNRLATHIAGRTVTHENIVNCPNWIFLTFKIGNSDWFYPSISGIISYYQELDIKEGILTRRIRFKNRKGQRTLIETNRIVHMADPHFGAIRYVIVPENYSEWIKVRTMLDGSVLNSGVQRYRQLNSKHWKSHSLERFSRNGVYLSMKTNQSNIEVAEAAKIRIFAGKKEIRPSIKCLTKGEDRIGQEFKFFAKEKETYKIEKTVSIFTSNDKGIHSPVRAAIESVQNARSFKALVRTHKQAWDRLWRRFDIQIKGDDFSQMVLRLYIFHLLQTASLHNIKLDAGLPARGLHGEAYGGHIFWDEIFTTPFYSLHVPEIAKALLLYRYRRLPQARENAEKEGCSGAMFPWQSAISGKEETQVIHLNPMSGTWGPDYSCLQRHVSFAIAYNVWQYWKNTGDFDFLLNYGAEMILSIAQFGASLAKFDSKDGRYHTEGLMGPDEFHESLPGSSKPGLKDNAYTNLMIVWTILKAQKILSVLPEDHKTEILKKLRLRKKDFPRWDDITHKMKIIINSEGIISQFDGYFGLKELDWEKYKEKYGNIQRMDRILKAEGQSPDDYKVAKQADALMFFYLVPFSEAEGIFRRLGYSFDKNILRKNFEYYLKRTSHGSTLSKVVYCCLAQLLGNTKESWQWFRDVLESDVYDTQGGTTQEGIHAGLMGGSIDIVMRNFVGLNTLENTIKINPNLPKNWQKIKLRLRYKERWISLLITKNRVTILIQGPATKFYTFPVEVSGRVYFLLLGKTYKISLKKKTT